jgi:hypothetical protein
MEQIIYRKVLCLYFSVLLLICVFSFHYTYYCRDSAVNIATSYGLDERRAGV